jgi:serine/threonine-protein kinase
MNERAPQTPRVGEPAAAPLPVVAGPGARVGPYVLGKLLGAGTGGRVFEVVHEKLGRRAALKLLDPAQAARPAARAQFLGEAVAVARISHPHIVEVTDVVEEPGHAALVMELLEGQSLGAAMSASSGAPLPPERFLPILAQVCEALAAAHAAGFVHRDLKPENVFLCARPDGADFVKLLDFGVATTFAAASTSSSGALVVGTPAYAAPEQAAGGAVDRTADIYAVGVIVYELACGRLPYDGWTAGQFLIQHQSAPVPRLPGAVRATPLGQALDNLVQRCMAKRPEDRFGSAAELARTFHALAQGDFATARATLPPARLGPSTRWRGPAAVVLALAAAAALAWRSTAPAPQALATPVQEAATNALAASPPSSVTLTFTSEPSGAQVRGPRAELYGVTPFVRVFPRSDETLTLEVTRAGYAPTRLEVAPSSPRAVSVTLARAPRRAHAKSRVRRLGSEKTIDPFRR